MTFHFVDLDAVTREFMLSELAWDEASKGGPYIGRELTPLGAEQYPKLLHEAMHSGDPDFLAADLEQPGLLDIGAPVNSADRLAWTEFNRYYMRAICRRALEASGDAIVVVYRARPSRNPQRDKLQDAPIPAQELLDDLRSSISGQPSTGLGAPNSGMSVRLTAPASLEVAT